MKITETDIQVRFADIDILGHVNNVNLQHYFDLGKSDYMRTVLDLGAFPASAGAFPITAATQTDYIAQTRPGEAVYVETGVEKIGTKSMTLVQRLIARDGGEVKAASRSVMVAFDFAAQQTVAVTDEWRAKAGF